MQDVGPLEGDQANPIEDHRIRRIGPVHFEHVNFKARSPSRSIPYADAGFIQRQPVVARALV